MTASSLQLPNSPGEILDHFGIDAPEQIDIEAIAFNLGARVKTAPLRGCEGRILGVGDRAIITINSNASWGRQRFTIAHELGHWLKDRHLVMSRCSEDEIARGWGDCQSNQREVRANKFAADLLLPVKLFKKRAVNRSHTLDACSQLACEFQTSLTATAIRYVQCGMAPSVLIFSEGGRRTWFARNALVPENLWPREELDPGSLAWRLTRSERFSDCRDDIDVAHWFSGVPEGRSCLVESCARVAAGVLSMLWWEDESLILEIFGDS